MTSRLLLYGTLLAGFACADTLTLRDGRTIQGTFLDGTSRQIRMAVDNRVESFYINEVADLKFGSGSSNSAPAPPAPAEDRPRAAAEPPPPPPPPPQRDSPSASGIQRAMVEIPSGTSIVVRMIDDVDSQRDRVGQTFKASIDEPVMVGAETIIPRGADVMMKLTDDKESGKLTGKTELTLDILTVRVNGRLVDIDTAEVTTSSGSRTGKTAKVVGGTAALGAIIGAIAGGGKGAAIGAGSGAAVGGGVQVLTKGQRVRIPSETRLSFTLQQPVRI
ncbi:MAG: hypothetical protein ABJF23_03705 [Bryobacteraceae bacterium]